MGLNIRSFMGGRNDLWAKSKNKVGLNTENGKKVNKTNGPDFINTSCSDGMMEFYSFQYTIDIGLGICKRIAQEKGPITFKFKKQDDMKLQDYFTYMQIDGEVYKLKNPDRIKLKTRTGNQWWKAASSS